MDSEMDNSNKYESVYSNIVKAGKRRKYFFDVKTTKGGDYYITMTESTRKFQGEGYERHKIFLYKEDFNQFLEALTDTVNHVKEELIPDFDYEQFNRPYDPDASYTSESTTTTPESDTTSTPTDDAESTDVSSEDVEDDISW